MKKLKYQGGLTKHLTTRRALRNRTKFSKLINDNGYLKVLANKIQSDKPFSAEVASFSSSRDFIDQVLSILSFLKYVGSPSRWTLYSDGSHSEQEVRLISESFDFLEFRLVNLDDPGLEVKANLLEHRDSLIHYAKSHPLGKKLFFYLNHPVGSPTIFLDTDILIYSRASIMHNLIKENVDGFFLPEDAWGCLDSRYRALNGEQLYQVNAGFFLLNHEISEIREGLNFLDSLNSQYEYFSEQTVFHILFRANSFLPLDPRIFVLNSSDQFDFSYMYNRESIAARHYTGPVRHKMWQRDWDWHLSAESLKVSG